MKRTIHNPIDSYLAFVKKRVKEKQKELTILKALVKSGRNPDDNKMPHSDTLCNNQFRYHCCRGQLRELQHTLANLKKINQHAVKYASKNNWFPKDVK